MSEFHFANPWALVLLAAVPLLLAAFRHGDAGRAAALRKWGRAPDGAAGITRRRWKRGLESAACMLVAVALGRPTMQKPAPLHPGPANGDVVFLLDVSRSMLAGDVQAVRLFRARALINELAARAGTQRLGLVAFAGTQSVQCPLTMDHAFFREMVLGTSPDAVARGGSKLGDAIRFAATHAFDDLERDSKTLVLVSDGEDQESGPENAARAAARRGIRVLTIGVGDEVSGALVPESMFDRTPVMYKGKPVRTRLSPGPLRTIAAAAGGAYVRAGTGMLDSAAVYAAHLAPSTRRVRGNEADGTLWLGLLAAAVLLLAWESALPERKVAQAAMWVLVVPGLPHSGFAQTMQDFFERGSKAINQRQWGEAIKEFAEASRMDPSSAVMRFNVARALYEFKAYSEAATSFEMAAGMTGDPKLKAKSKLGQGNALYRHSQGFRHVSEIVKYMRQALDAYTAALAADPDLFDAEFNRNLVERKLSEMTQQEMSPQGAGVAEPSAAPEDAERILSKTRPGTAPVAHGKSERVERDW